MQLSRSLSIIGAVFTVAASAMASAPSPVGAWKGKIKINMPTLPPNTPPQQRQMITQMMAQLSKATIQLTLKANKTFTSKTVGGPSAAQREETGKWSATGNTVTITPDRKAGMTSGPASQSLTLSKDGKMLTLVIPPSGGASGEVVFTR